VNKTKFLELVKNPDSIEENDLTKLDALIAEHPYSQIIHVLNVKGRKAFNKPDFEQSLNLAATYTYDRSLLQSIVDGANIVAAAGNPIQNDLQAEIEEISEETSDFSWIQEGDDEDDIFIDDHTTKVETSETAENTINQAEDVGDAHRPLEQEYTIDQQLESSDDPEKNTEQLQTEQLEKDLLPANEVDEVEVEPDSETDTGDTVEIVEAEQKNDEVAETEPTLELAGTRKEIEINVNSDTDQGSLTEPEKEEPKEEKEEPKEEEANRQLNDPLEIEIASGGIHAELMRNLNQLQENKQYFEDQPKKNGGPKNRTQQIEIIDNFIKSSPVLSKPNLNAESEVVSQDDLSKNSTQFSEEVASENLAKIYLKQGKRKDAEKIYKKLMVKFPQKKAYFADRIQKSKKK
jgi:hypothetical protein